MLYRSIWFVTLYPLGVRSIAMNVICLSVCVSVCPLAYLKNDISIDFTKFSVHAIVAVARASYDDNAIRYVLPVL